MPRSSPHLAYKLKEDARRYQSEWRGRPEVRQRRLLQQRQRRRDSGVRLAQRDGELRRRYGITLADYDLLFDVQGGKCAICKHDDFKPSDWHVDHDHATGKVRGVLCRHCNRALGAVKDRVDTLRNAIAYLLCRR